MALASFTLDHQQRRIAGDRLPLFAAGMDLNGFDFSDTWIDPITETLWLRPRPLYPDWNTSNAGEYVKLAKADYTLAAAGKWEDRHDQAFKGPWLSLKDSNAAAGERSAVTIASYSKNRGFYIAFFSFGEGSNFVQFECGWGATANYLLGTAVRFWSGGLVEVYRSGTKVGEGSLTSKGSSASTQNLASTVVDALLMPSRGRELLIVSRTRSGGFTTPLLDIDEADTDPTLVPAGNFWWNAPTGAAQIMCAPLRFATSGYATSIDLSFFEAPVPDDVLEKFDNETWLGGEQSYRVYGHPPYVGTQTASVTIRKIDGTSFVPDSSEKKAKLRVDLTSSDSGYSPSIYGIHAAYDIRTDLTDSSESVQIENYITSASFSVTAEPDGVTLDLEIKDPTTLQDDYAAKLLTVGNRPLDFSIGSNQILNGRTAPPVFTDAAVRESQRATIEVRDLWKALEQYMFVERFPLDGFNLSKAIRFLVKFCGIDSSLVDVEDTTLQIPITPGNKAGDFNMLIEVGDNPAMWIKRLQQDFAGTWYYGFKPTTSGVGFFSKSPETIGTLPTVTLYETIEDAVDLGGYSEPDATYHVFRSFRETVLEPEANDVRVTGFDPRSRRPIQAHKPDSDSQNVKLKPSERPDNWLGDIRRTGLVDPALTTQALVDWACGKVYDRVTPVQYHCEFKAELILDDNGLPLWRGDPIELYGRGTYRIETFGSDLDHEIIEPEFYWRETIYTARRII